MSDETTEVTASTVGGGAVGTAGSLVTVSATGSVGGPSAAGKNIRYLMLVIVLTALAFSLDVISSSADVELSTKTILNQNGDEVSLLQVTYPLWHQIIGFIKHFLYGLAVAIFITVFVVNKLQKNQQEETKNELKELRESILISVFDALFKKIIPEEIFEVLKQEIIENKVLRKEAKWIYDFSIKDEKIVGRMTTRYELHNLSQQPVTDPIKLELDALGGQEYKIISAECLSKDGKVLVRYSLNDDDRNNKNVEIVKGIRTTLKYSIEIPSGSFVEYKTIFKREYEGDIVDSQATKVPVVGADIIVNFPENYEFDISATMSTKPKLIIESSIQKIYRVEGGILPWQGFTYCLAQKKGSNKKIKWSEIKGAKN